MKITIETSRENAIREGVNEYGEQTVEVDVSTLTSEERTELVRRRTPIFVDYAINTEENFRAWLTTQTNKRAADAIAEAARVEERVAHDLEIPASELVFRDWNGNLRLQLYRLNEQSDPRVKARIAEAEALIKADKEEKKRQIEESDAAILPMLERYEAGESRENTINTVKYSRLSDGMQERVNAEDKRRSDAVKEKIEERKTAQLADAVARLGTDEQKERWEAGVMPRKEALFLIWQEAVSPAIEAGLEPDGGNGYHMGENVDDEDETEKRTLSAEEWEAAKQIKAALGDEWEFSYWQESGNYYDEYQSEARIVKAVIVRAEKTVGEYSLTAEFVISRSDEESN
jgi:hypothetical protein